jgi:hypothetical protein
MHLTPASTQAMPAGLRIGECSSADEFKVMAAVTIGSLRARFNYKLRITEFE